MRSFLFFLLALTIASLAESLVSPNRVTDVGTSGLRTTISTTTTTTTTTETRRKRSSVVLRDVIDGDLQWYAGATPLTSTSSTSTSNTVSRSAVERKLRNAAERFMKFQSGYFCPMMPNDNPVELNRLNRINNNGYNNGYSNGYNNGYGNGYGNRNGNVDGNSNGYNNSNGYANSNGYKNNDNNINNIAYGNNNRNNNNNVYSNNNGYGSNNGNNKNNAFSNNNRNNNKDAYGNNNGYRNNNRNNNGNNYGYNKNNAYSNNNGYGNGFNPTSNDYDAANDRTSMYADDFVFRGPVIGPLNKWDYIDVLDYFKVYEAFPDINPNCFGFSVDAVDPMKVRFFVKATGSYQKPLGGFMGNTASKFSKPDGRKYMGATEAWSITFNDLDRMQVKCMTGGYVVDRFEEDGVLCTTKGKGSLYGILHTIGVEFLDESRATSVKLLQGLFSKKKGPDALFPKLVTDKRRLPLWWIDKR